MKTFFHIIDFINYNKKISLYWLNTGFYFFIPNIRNGLIGIAGNQNSSNFELHGDLI
jgi:hypothetical protein